jgi:hypothetical protein
VYTSESDWQGLRDAQVQEGNGLWLLFRMIVGVPLVLDSTLQVNPRENDAVIFHLLFLSYCGVVKVHVILIVSQLGWGKDIVVGTVTDSTSAHIFII